MKALLLPLPLLLLSGPHSAPSREQQTIDVRVTEGTSMSVAVSPDGRTLAIDLQGSIWTLPSSGGAARQITDGFDDARQPAWSPDGSTIAFQGYRDGGYDIWLIAPDGGGQRKLTSGIYDDREPAWSHDGTRIAFSSDRAADGNYDIWVADVRTGAVQRITTAASNEYMPTWSPDDREIAFTSARGGGNAVWIVTLAGHAERRHTPMGAGGDAPSWGPGGAIVYHTTNDGGGNRLQLDSVPLTAGENVFPFRASWASATDLYYVSDGKIKRRGTGGGAATQATTVEFSATLRVNPARYTRRVRDVDSRAPRRVLGVVAPAISPDGSRIVFAALGDIWLMTVGGRPENITRDEFLDTEPAWSPDGMRIAYATDKGGGFLNIWIRDMRTGEERQLTRVTTSAMAPVWSPDGTRIAFLDVDGLWRRATVSVVNVASGEVTRLRAAMFGPGTPTWSPDGRRVAVASLVPHSSRFREGLNQVLTLPVAPDAGEAQTITLLPERSIDSRAGAGPVWSPDGSRMAVINSGHLMIVPVSRDGAPAGAPRTYTSDMAHSPTWTADSRSVLYQSTDRLRILDVGTGAVRDVPLEFTYTPAVPTARYVIHAGTVIDPVTSTTLHNVDITIEGNRIRRVDPHGANFHSATQVIDAGSLTIIPGLIEYHTHLQKDMGAAHGRSYLAFGITTVRSPGGTPYEAVEDREAVDAGVRPGPRIFTAGYLTEWQRSYYKMSVAVTGPEHLDLELERARVLQHDMLKSYVRMPDLEQRRMVEFAHSIGIPASSHEIYPSAFVGIDGVEHTTGTSRRGYSPKVGPQQRSYSDVAAIIGAAQMTFTPTFTLSAAWLRRLADVEPSLRGDPRFGLMVPWVRSGVAGARGGGAGAGAPAPASVQFSAGAQGEMLMAAMRAGARIVAGTDTPNPANLHAELLAYVAAGMTPMEALRAATSTPAAALALDAGAIAPGKIADLVMLEGNPLDNITNTLRVRRVVANGRVFELADLLRQR